MNRTLSLYIISAGLAVVAVAVWGYNNFYLHSSSSYIDLFYRLVNWALLILIFIAITKDKIPKTLTNFLKERRLPYVASRDDLQGSTDKLITMRKEKRELVQTLAARKSEALALAKSQGAEILAHARAGVASIEKERQEKLARLRHEAFMQAKMLLLNKAVADLEDKLRANPKKVEAEEFEKLFANLK